MRNGHTAEIKQQVKLPFDGKRGPEFFLVWKGRCVQCDETKTWNLDGTYSVSGPHEWDVVSKIAKSRTARRT